jgi:hypothetical protein
MERSTRVSVFESDKPAEIQLIKSKLDDVLGGGGTGGDEIPEGFVFIFYYIYNQRNMGDQGSRVKDQGLRARERVRKRVQMREVEREIIFVYPTV